MFGKNVSYRCGVAARTVAAIGGGYLFTTVGATLLAQLLPVARADATIISTMLSFIIYAGTVIWVFAVRSLLRVWIGMCSAITLLTALLWLHRGVP